jgi:large subunit ribosomal protein L18
MYVKAQVIDATGHILAHISDKGLKGKTKVERASLAGQQLAELMKKQSIASAAFDRNGYLYHGRIAAFADGLRQGGIQI